MVPKFEKCVAIITNQDKFSQQNTSIARLQTNTNSDWGLPSEKSLNLNIANGDHKNSQYLNENRKKRFILFHGDLQMKTYFCVTK